MLMGPGSRFFFVIFVTLLHTQSPKLSFTAMAISCSDPK